MPRAIIIGATSGIGRALAEALARDGYVLGLSGRRVELLEELGKTLPGEVHIARMDVARQEEAIAQLDTLLDEMDGDVELIVISSGVGIDNPDLAWAPERDTLAVNVLGFTAMATAAFRYFQRRGSGHLAGISSIAGIRGSRFNPAYGASKAFESNYMEALRARARHLHLPIAVTDIRPGYVATPMTARNRNMFWVASADTAAKQIVAALRRKERIAYITRRWIFIAWLLRWMPGWMLERL